MKYHLTNHPYVINNENMIPVTNRCHFKRKDTCDRRTVVISCLHCHYWLLDQTDILLKIISTDKRPLNKLPNKYVLIDRQNIFVIHTHVLVIKMQTTGALESGKSVEYWYSYMSYASECKEFT